MVKYVYLIAIALLWPPHAQSRGQSFEQRNPYSSAQSPEPQKVELASIRDYQRQRHEVLNLLGGAAKRVWLVTSFISDSDLVSALFVAQFRGLDTKVIVGKTRAHHPLSRLPFLQQQKIPSFLDQGRWPFNFESALLTDQRLVLFSNSFDPQTPTINIRALEASSEELSQFESHFKQMIDRENRPNYRPLPQVGRSRTAPSYNASPNHSPRAPSPSAAQNVTEGGGYNYNRTQQQKHAPQGVPTRLPKQTIRQQQDRF